MIIFLCSLSITWLKWCLFNPGHIQTWIVAKSGQRDDAESEAPVSSVPFENRPPVHSKRPPPLSPWSGWIIHFVCELSVTWAVNQDLSASGDLACSLTFFTRAQKGVFVYPTPQNHCRHWWKRLSHCLPLGVSHSPLCPGLLSAFLDPPPGSSVPEWGENPP